MRRTADDPPQSSSDGMKDYIERSRDRMEPSGPIDSVKNPKPKRKPKDGEPLSRDNDEVPDAFESPYGGPRWNKRTELAPPPSQPMTRLKDF
jgi:hypothetical protein